MADICKWRGWRHVWQWFILGAGAVTEAELEIEMAPGVPAETSATALCLKAQFTEGLTPLKHGGRAAKGERCYSCTRAGSVPLEVHWTQCAIPAEGFCFSGKPSRTEQPYSSAVPKHTAMLKLIVAIQHSKDEVLLGNYLCVASEKANCFHHMLVQLSSPRGCKTAPSYSRSHGDPALDQHSPFAVLAWAAVSHSAPWNLQSPSSSDLPPAAPSLHMFLFSCPTKDPPPSFSGPLAQPWVQYLIPTHLPAVLQAPNATSWAMASWLASHYSSWDRTPPVCPPCYHPPPFYISIWGPGLHFPHQESEQIWPRSFISTSLSLPGFDMIWNILGEGMQTLFPLCAYH